MDYHIDKECSALGGLFQTIINDMKTQAPIWEDFISKAGKLHSTLRTTIVAIGAFLEAFQKVADMATNTRGATREIGSALTRLCMRHRSIEQKLKIFTSSILDMCVNPLQERVEEWKKTVVQLDKDHAKEYKKARTEIKKASSDTMRLQKKVRKGKNDMQNKLDSALQEVNDKFMLLEETEKNAVRTALIEERNRFCLFISCLKPVVDEEIAMLTEITHLQEVIDALCMQAGDPYSLPPASEQVIRDLKVADNHSWSFQVTKTPPSSPSSIGSRKSSMCSISSIASSSSGSTKSHSPSHHMRHRASSQILELQLNTKPPLPGTVRLSSVSSQDSGFTSQDTLFLKNPTPPPLDLDSKNSVHEVGSGGSGSEGSNTSTPSPSHYSGPPSTSASTWSNWPDPPHVQAKPDPTGLPFDRPHTISTAYERHTRPALTAQTFEPPDPTHLLDPQSQQQARENQPPQSRPSSQTAPSTPSLYAVPSLIIGTGVYQQPQLQPQLQQKEAASPYAVPCIVPPQRRDSRPPSMVGPGGDGAGGGSPHRAPPPAPGPKPRVKPVAPPVVPDFNSSAPDQSKKKNVYLPTAIPQPVYVNMNELATMAVAKQKEVEEHRRQQQKKAGEEPGEEGSGDTVARPTTARCQRSVSMPAQDVHPLSKAIEELNQRTAAIRNQSPHRVASPRRQLSAGPPGAATSDQPKNQEGRELADAIKELEASTAALQLVYDGGSSSSNTGGRPGARHSVAGYGPSPDAGDDGDASTPKLPCDEAHVSYYRTSSHRSMQSAAKLPRDCSSHLGLPPYPSVPGLPAYRVPAPATGWYRGHPGHPPPASGHPPRVAAIGRSQSFRLPPSYHPNFTKGYPAGPGNTASLRRGSLPAKPPPAPIRRTSSISSSMGVVLPGPPGGGSSDGRERSGSKTPTPQGTPTRHRRTTSDMACLPAPDRPPDTGNARHSFAGPPTGRICDSDSDDSDDGSWPPPPPADFMTPADPEPSDFGRRGPRGSVTDSHSGVMQSLNAVFGGQSHPPPPTGAQIWHPDSLPLSHPHAPSASNHRQERALSQSSDDVTPTAEAPPSDNLMNQIKRGVSLRRTTSNDRSAPRLPQR